jgi:hypothetical protein
MRDQAAVTELQAWLSSPAGKKRMRAAAAAAKKERERLSRSTTVPSELLRARVTI